MAPLENMIRFGTSSWAYEGWQGLSITGHNRRVVSARTHWPNTPLTQQLDHHFSAPYGPASPTDAEPHIIEFALSRYAGRSRCAHVSNHWTAMPPLVDQHTRLEKQFTAPFVVLRLLTPLGLAYEKAVERYIPYDRIVQPQPRMRQETVVLAKQALAEGKCTYVLVKNRSAGCVR